MVVEGGAAGTEYPMSVPTVRVGRGPDVEVAIDDPELSSTHVAIDFDDGMFHLTDLGSTNGTKVNDQPATSQVLEHGDRIHIGRQVLQLVLAKREAAPRQRDNKGPHRRRYPGEEGLADDRPTRFIEPA